MILSTVTDEVTPDRTTGAFPKIFKMASGQGVHNFEIRMVEAKRFPLVEATAWERLKRIAAELDIHYSAVSPGLFKVDLHSENCLAILEGVGRSNFSYVWDTGNLYEAENRNFRISYELLKRHIRNVHLKDGSFVDGKMHWRRFGTGDTDIAGQVQKLLQDGYAHTLTVEAKCEPHEDDDFLISMAYLRSVLDRAQVAPVG